MQRPGDQAREALTLAVQVPYTPRASVSPALHSWAAGKTEEERYLEAPHQKQLFLYKDRRGSPTSSTKRLYEVRGLFHYLLHCRFSCRKNGKGRQSWPSRGSETGNWAGQRPQQGTAESQQHTKGNYHRPELLTSSFTSSLLRGPFWTSREKPQREGGGSCQGAPERTEAGRWEGRREHNQSVSG